MAASLPVVVSNTEPLPEILGAHRLVVELDPDAFHQVFPELLADPARARALGGGAETEPKPSMAVSWKPGKPSSI